MRSAYVELNEQSDHRALVRVRLSQPRAQLDVTISGCTLSESGPAMETDSGLANAYVALCDGPLRGRKLAVDGFGADVEEVALLVHFADGATHNGLLLASEPALTLPVVQSGALVALGYVRLGLSHIAGGVDHLLFLALLVLQLRTLRDVLWAETAFTISHALSFSATALGWVDLPAAPTEACIALSLLLLALDCRAGEKLRSRGGPVLLALVFGLVHGLGFAGGLRDIGLPDQHIAAALLGFAGGVEIGQVAVVLLLVGLLPLGRGRRGALIAERALIFGGGGLAVYWLLARSWLLFSEV